MKKLKVILLFIAVAPAAYAGLVDDLILEVWKGDVAKVESIIERGVAINSLGREDETALMRAAAVGDVKMLALLIRHGAKVDIQNSAGHTALMTAANNGQVDAVLFLLENGADVNAKTGYGTTVFMYAAAHGDPEIIKSLLRHGADPDARNRGGKNAGQLAAESGHPEITDLIANRKAWSEQERPAPNTDSVAITEDVAGYQESGLDTETDASMDDISTQLKFISAAEQGNVSVVKQLLKQGMDINAHPYEKKTAFMAALITGHITLAEWLMDQGADIGLTDENGWSALHWAVLSKRNHLFSKLVAASDVNATAKDDNSSFSSDGIRYAKHLGHDFSDWKNHGDTVLIVAISVNNIEAISLLLNAGVEVNAQDSNGWTALMTVAGGGNAEKVKLLLNAGAEVNAKSNNGATALMLAANTGNAEAVKLLLDAGSEVNAKENDGWTALMLAARKGNAEAVKLLLDAGAEVNAKKNDGSTASHFAADNENMFALSLLTNAGADVNAKNSEGKTVLTMTGTNSKNRLLEKIKHELDSDRALMQAAHEGNAGQVKLLLDIGVDVNAKTNDGVTALMYASSSGSAEAVKLLLDAGSEVNAKENDGWTALMRAARQGNAEAVKLLLAAGADVNAKDKDDGWTPLDRVSDREVRTLITQAGGYSVIEREKGRERQEERKRQEKREARQSDSDSGGFLSGMLEIVGIAAEGYLAYEEGTEEIEEAYRQQQEAQQREYEQQQREAQRQAEAQQAEQEREEEEQQREYEQQQQEAQRQAEAQQRERERQAEAQQKERERQEEEQRLIASVQSANRCLKITTFVRFSPVGSWFVGREKKNLCLSKIKVGLAFWTHDRKGNSYSIKCKVDTFNMNPHDEFKTGFFSVHISGEAHLDGFRNKSKAVPEKYRQTRYKVVTYDADILGSSVLANEQVETVPCP